MEESAMGQPQPTKRTVSRRDFLRLAGITSGASLLAACAPQATPAPQAVEPTKASEPAKVEEKPTEKPAAPSAEQVKVSWWNQFSTPTCKEWFPKIVTDFETENPTIKVEFEITGGPPGGGDYNEVLLARIAAGNPPDTCTLWDPPTGMGSRGALATIDNFMNTAKYASPSKFYAGVLKSCQFKGKTYGLPASAGVGCLFMNTKILQDKGISTKRADFPKDWQGYRELSKTLTTWEGDKLTVAGGVPWTSGWLQSTWAQLNGGTIFDSDKLQYSVSSKENEEWLTFWLDWLNDQYKGDIELLNTFGAWDDVYPDSNFQKGLLGVSNSGAWACTDAQIPFDWEVVPFPTGPSGKKPLASYWPNWWAMPKGSTHPEQAFLFSEYMTTKGWVTWYVNATMDTPAWIDFPQDSVNKALAKLTGDARAKELQAFFSEELKSVSDMWTSPVEAFANDNLTQAIDAVMHKKSTPAEALANAQKVIQGKLDETLKNG
jgi:multiple sugar transport system substrate-binding protein